jgi:hypothetical protein
MQHCNDYKAVSTYVDAAMEVGELAYLKSSKEVIRDYELYLANKD